MRKFSWHTHEKKTEDGLYLGNIIYGYGGIAPFRKCYEHYKPNLKGEHTHNHLRNALERKLNKSKSSRKRCHNHLNKGYNYKFVDGLCCLRRAK